MHTGRRLLQRTSIAILLVSGVAGGCGEDPAERRPAARPSATPGASAAAPAPKAPDGIAWTRSQAVRRLDGRRIRAGRRTVRLDRSTLTCGGVGRPATRIRGRDAWTRFRCVQPTFPRGVFAGPDAVFLAEPQDERRAAITRARLTDY